ncbi:integrase [Mycobacterium rhizamassiliense]|uniref:Integrase n=1 Tax=Mycobacterium rhizamassiliense TaxID=1841860 RepID=A0A2U3NWE6_9MYCO|nr:tyrosine-type recombinase/integrase [Mycobacterium rhizamassiliense]SPM35783.1 integrase [Mycobacterium rhizamassiliense]
MSKSKRSPYGDGGLFKRADGMWVGTVEIPSADGNRRQKRVYAKHKTEAKRKRDDLRAEVAKGVIPVSSTTTVAVWLRRWADDIKKPHVRPNTFDWYDEAIRLHITPHIGTRKLRHLTAEEVRYMLRQATTPANAQRAHKTLKMALKDAVREGLIGRNVAEAVERPKHLKQTRGVLISDTAKTAIRAAIDLEEDDETAPALAARWIAGFLTGARPAELLGLEWDRVDLDNGLMDLAWQLQQVDKAHGCGEPQGDAYPCGKKRASFCSQARWDLPAGFEYRECVGTLLWTRPKTQAGTRLVPIVEPLRVMLDRHRQRPGPNPHNLVWHRPDGRPLTRHDDAKYWGAVLKAAGLPKVDVYAIRHSTATLLQELGVPEETRMVIMGQSSVAAHRMYIHVDQTQAKTALNRLERLLLSSAGSVVGAIK